MQDVSDHYNDIIAQTEERERETRRLELEVVKWHTEAYDMIISANLAQNTYCMISYEHFLNLFAKNAGNFDELIEIGVKSVPDPHKENFRKTFFRKALLKRYYEGKKETENQLALQDALYTAKSANEAKSDFLSSMSHEIRTPMNAIIGMTTLADQYLDDQEYMKNCLDKMVLASNRLLTLINDVLDISKVESGKVTLNPVAVSLADTVANLINIVKHQVNGKNQKLDVRVHSITKEYPFADEMRLN